MGAATNDRAHDLAVEQKPDGRGLATNGGELLCLALEHTDTMAEVHNTLRRGMPVTLRSVEVASRDDRGSGEAAV